jgi:hypothetical protein
VFPRDIVCLRNISTLHKGDYDDDDNDNNNNNNNNKNGAQYVKNGAQYVKKTLQGTKNNAKLESPWKRPNSKFLA